LATLGVFSIDAIRERDRAGELTPTQYVDLDLRTKERIFSEDVSILGRTHALLFGAVRHEIRNAIAHKRYEIKQDGSVVLYDFDPGKKLRITVGQLSQEQLKMLITSLERAVDIFEMSLLIFQHNNGNLLNELGHYSEEREYSEKEVREMIYLNAPSAFMRIDGINIQDGDVTIDASFLSFESRPSGGEVFVSSKDRDGKPIEYWIPVANRELSARDQTLRLLQLATMYCGRYRTISIRTKDILGGKPLGEVKASVDLLLKARAAPTTKEEFLKLLTVNTFTVSKKEP
jgi:hypothetical protein